MFDRARDEIVCHFRRAPPGGGRGVWEEDEADCGTDKIAYVRYELETHRSSNSAWSAIVVAYMPLIFVIYPVSDTLASKPLSLATSLHSIHKRLQLCFIEDSKVARRSTILRRRRSYLRKLNIVFIKLLFHHLLKYT